MRNLNKRLISALLSLGILLPCTSCEKDNNNINKDEEIIKVTNALNNFQPNYDYHMDDIHYSNEDWQFFVENLDKLEGENQNINPALRECGALLLLAMFNEDNDYDKLIKAINEQDYEELYLLLNIQNNEDKNRLNHIIYLMNTNLGYNEDYEEALEKNVSSTYLIDTFSLILNRLIAYNETHELTLQENLIIYSLITKVITLNDQHLNQIGVNIKNNAIVDPKYYNNMLELHQNFYKYLSYKYNTRISDIECINSNIQFNLWDYFHNVFRNEEDISSLSNDFATTMANFPELSLILHLGEYPFDPMAIINQINMKNKHNEALLSLAK